MTASQFPIEAGHVMMFARAIGDFNPVYQDVDAASKSEVGGIIAPPTFVQAGAQYDPDYSLRPQPGVPWFGSGATPTGRVTKAEPATATPGPSSERSGGTGLHAEQHYEYHRPVRAGEVLTLTVRPGKAWEKQGRRGGLLHFRETIIEYRGENGELAVTARGVGVRTEQIVKD
jgi:acyl dehydratase